MKLLCVTDTHWGCRNDNPHFYEYQKKFLDKVFFPYIEHIKPDAILHLGDLVDNRRSANYRTYETLDRDFITPMFNTGIEQHWLVGNHDSYWKNTLAINAVDKFVNSGVVHSKPEEAVIGDKKVLFVPWICDDNREESLRLINNSDAQYCFGHLELDGFEVRRGLLHKGGTNRNIFNNFDVVLSGHFHNRSHGNNIRYIGAPFQYDWSDYGEYKGVALLDTETNRISYIKNPFNMFNILEYRDSETYEVEHLKDTYVRIFVKEKESESRFNDLVSRINDIWVIDLTIVDNTYKDITLVDDVVIVDEVKTVFDNYIDSLDLPNKSDVQDLFESIYKESISSI